MNAIRTNEALSCDLKRTLGQFFEAENDRNWAAYRTYLHPEIEWVLYGTTTKTIRGIDAYLSFIKAAYQGSKTRFKVRFMKIFNEQTRAAVLLVNDRGERSLDVFEFQDGLICREEEFLLDSLKGSCCALSSTIPGSKKSWTRVPGCDNIIR